jgi:hypothetical protein
MAWKDTNFERFGVVKIEGDKVKVYKNQYIYITISVNKPVTSANWVDGDLIIALSDERVRCYKDHDIYTYMKQETN